MAKILDPDLLRVGTELTMNTVTLEFTLNVDGNLIAKDGVGGGALYSKFVELWTTAAYNKYPFPGYVIGDPRAGMFVWGFDGATYNGWAPADEATRQYLRDIGWAEFDSGGTLEREHVGVVSLGSVNSGAQLYYQLTSSGAPADFTYDDAVNEGIKVYHAGTSDSRTFFKAFCREEGYSYAVADLTLIGETGTGPYKIGMPLSNLVDNDIVEVDANIDGTSPYQDIVVRYFDTAFSKDIDTTGTARSYGIVIDVGTHSAPDGVVTLSGTTLTTALAGMPVDSTYDAGTLYVYTGTNEGSYTIASTTAGTVTTVEPFAAGSDSGISFSLQRATAVDASKQQIYTKLQYLYRQNTDIDTSGTGSVTGKTATPTLSMAGSTLEAGKNAPANTNGGGTGVLVLGHRAEDATTIDLYDNGGTKRNYPFNATGYLNFNSFLQTGGAGYYRMYYTTLGGTSDDYGEVDAVTVYDVSLVDIAGTITGAQIAWDYAYSSNDQGGRTPGTDAAVTIVAGNPGYAKPVVTTHTITETLAQNITLTAEQDRGYSNP